MSDLAGYTVRVAELFEALELLPPVPEAKSPGNEVRDCDLSPKKHSKQHEVTGKGPEGAPVSSPTSAGEEVVSEKHEDYQVSPPLYVAVQGSRVLEVSIHLSPVEVQEMLVAVFNKEVEAEAVLVVTTFQQAATDIWPIAGRLVEGMEVSERLGSIQGAEGELKTLLRVFLGWQHLVTSRLKSLGHWADAIHPFTGLPVSTTLSGAGRGASGSSELLHGGGGGGGGAAESTVVDISDGPRYRQAGAVRLLQGHPSVSMDGVEVVDHPRYGTRAFPASLFTTAPVSVLLSAIRDSCTLMNHQDYYGTSIAHGDEASGSSNVEDGLDAWAAMSCNNVTVSIPRTQQLIVKNLNAKVRWGESLLITGPTGSGKTSLLRAIGGIWPLQAGTM